MCSVLEAIPAGRSGAVQSPAHSHQTMHKGQVVGYSMGAMQAFQWAAQYPAAVDRFVAICGTARTAEHNQLFLDSLRAAFCADAAFNNGDYESPPLRGFEAFATIYASWLTSQRFFARRLYRQVGPGIEDLDGFVALVKAFFMRHDANDLLAMAATWRAGDPSANDIYRGDFARAMRAISARGLIMPCDTDLYFRAEDSEADAALLSDCEFEPIRSDFGHAAGGGFDAAAVRLLNARIRRFLEN